MKMPSLFFKIFLWFWLVIVVVSGTFVVSAAVIRSRSADIDRWRQQYGLNLELRAQHSSELLEFGGKAALANYIYSLERLVLVNHAASSDSNRDYLFDESGRELIGQRASPEILSIVSQMGQDPPGMPHFFHQERVAAERIKAQRGEVYTFVMTIPEPPVLHQVLEALSKGIDGEGLVRLVEVLILAGVFCLWLARHITLPIDRLRLAVRGIASGHLEERVREEVISRHDELAELGNDFNRMADRIANLVNSQRRLLADVSHQLRSPLTRLNLALALARQRTNTDALEHLDRIEHEAEHLSKLVGQLLMLARVESGVDLDHKEVFDFGVVLHEVASDGDYEAQRRNRGVKFVTSSVWPVEGAFEMLRGAVENIVRNGIRHTADGTNVEIEIEGRSGPRNSQMVIQIRDHGSGVPEEDLAGLFIPFYQGSHGIRRSSDGTGLGLAIAERTFRLHGGKVTAANASDGGLIIRFELPMFYPNEIVSPTNASSLGTRSAEAARGREVF